jgi:uncharacterized protein
MYRISSNSSTSNIPWLLPRPRLRYNVCMKPKNALILHGTLGSPDGNWFSRLKDELEKRGLEVWLPQLPHPEQPSLKEEADFVHKNCPFPIDENTLVIGHSSGAILALILAQQNTQPIGAVAAVSVFHDNSLDWDPNTKLFDVDFEWSAIQQNARKLLFVHSDDDPYVPLEQAQYVADNCHAEIIVIPGQGHFNLEKSPNYKAFPELLTLLGLHGILPLTTFTQDGGNRKISYRETTQVTAGVERDVYSFDNDNSEDLAIVRVNACASTPRQKILTGTATIEGFVRGAGILTVETAEGTKKSYDYPTPKDSSAITLEIGDIMQWSSADDSSLVFYEIYRPSYADGRFENLSE